MRVPEAEVYAALGLPWIPPEIREDGGEVDAALAGRLPALVDLSDIRGDLHTHTRASDGHHTADAMVAAVHTRLGQDEREMTRRVCRALETGRVHVLAHPTGRLIGERPPQALDLDEVLRVAARTGVAVEVNGQPRRLDLNDVHARRARDLGALLALDTDAHAIDQLDAMRLAVGTARRGWVEADRVVNAWPLPRLEAWLARGRAGATPRGHHRAA